MLCVGSGQNLNADSRTHRVITFYDSYALRSSAVLDYSIPKLFY